jgi:hypothetical protein
MTTPPLVLWLDATDDPVADRGPNKHRLTDGCLPGVMSRNLVGATAVYVIRVPSPPTDPLLTGGFLGDWGAGGETDREPWVDGQVYSGFGSTRRYSVGAVDLSRPTVVAVTSTPEFWTYRANGVERHRTTDNAVGWGSSPKVGRSGGFAFPGTWAELLVFPRPLDPATLASVEGYLARRHGIPLPDGHPSASVVSKFSPRPTSSRRRSATGAG